jgi:prepilin-type N-terminal cleavage/methylation domain-containing protein
MTNHAITRISADRGVARRGLSLVELLVVIVIVSLLLSLAVMGVQTARESSRRATCASRMRQLALAATNFESTRNRFPLNMAGEQISPISETKTIRRYYSWMVEILPFIEQESLHAVVTSDPLVYDGSRWFPPMPLGSRITGFSCPSDPFDGGTSFRGCAGAAPGLFKMHYERLAPEHLHSLGVFANQGPIRAADITDGLSNTALLCEKARAGESFATANHPNRPPFNPKTDVWAALDIQTDPSLTYFNRSPDEMRALCGGAPTTPLFFTSVSGVAWHCPGLFQTVYNHVGAPNDKIVDCSNNSIVQNGYYGSHRATSYHPGGVNLARANGSVQFVNDSIELKVWRTQATKAGGESVTLP